MCTLISPQKVLFQRHKQEPWPGHPELGPSPCISSQPRPRQLHPQLPGVPDIGLSSMNQNWGVMDGGWGAGILTVWQR